MRIATRTCRLKVPMSSVAWQAGKWVAESDSPRLPTPSCTYSLDAVPSFFVKQLGECEIRLVVYGIGEPNEAMFPKAYGLQQANCTLI